MNIMRQEVQNILYCNNPSIQFKNLVQLWQCKSLTHIFFICISMPLFNHMLIFSSGYILLYTKFDSFVGLSKWMWKLEVSVIESDFYFLFYKLSVIVIEQWVLCSEETYIGHFDIALIWMFYEIWKDPNISILEFERDHFISHIPLVWHLFIWLFEKQNKALVIF